MLLSAGRRLQRVAAHTKLRGRHGEKTSTYNDGWPLMQPLGAKEAKLRNQNVTPGEQVLGQVIGNFSQAVIATTQGPYR